jgi:glycosyltransferase involved in cell wall biosynthesis
MKIFILGQKGIPALGGGVETHVDNLATRLSKLGHSVFAYTRNSYSDKNIKEYKGVKLISLPSVNTKSLDAISHTFLACLDFIFKRRKADIIHFHSIGPASLIWLIKLFRPKTKVFFTFHSQCYYNSKWGKLAKLYLSFGEKIGCKLADELIVVSKSLKEYVKNKYGRETIYIPNGVEIPKIFKANKIKEKWNLNEGSYILSVSRIVKNKGLEYLIEAYKNLNTNKKLVIVGDGGYKEELMKLADKNENIIFTGRQSGEVLNELYSNANLFVQPSEAEGLSISLLEAVSYKLPVLISNIDANIEVMGEDSFNFENKNSDDLKFKLESFLNKENQESLDKNIKIVYNKLVSEYNWDNIINKVIELYKRSLK